MEVTRDPMLPISWKGWDGDHSAMIYSDVTFLSDFGPWKAGQQVDSICLDNEKGKLTQWTSDGKEVHSVAVCITVRPPEKTLTGLLADERTWNVTDNGARILVILNDGIKSENVFHGDDRLKKAWAWVEFQMPTVSEDDHGR